MSGVVVYIVLFLVIYHMLSRLVGYFVPILKTTVRPGSNTPPVREKIRCYMFGLWMLSFSREWHFHVEVYAQPGQSGKLFGRTLWFGSGYNADSKYPSKPYNLAHHTSGRVAFSEKERGTEYFTYAYIDKRRPYEGQHPSRSQSLGFGTSVSMTITRKEIIYQVEDRIERIAHSLGWRALVGFAFMPYAQENHPVANSPVTSPVTFILRRK